MAEKKKMVLMSQEVEGRVLDWVFNVVSDQVTFAMLVAHKGGLEPAIEFMVDCMAKVPECTPKERREIKACKEQVKQIIRKQAEQPTVPMWGDWHVKQVVNQLEEDMVLELGPLTVTKKDNVFHVERVGCPTVKCATPDDILEVAHRTMHSTLN